MNLKKFAFQIHWRYRELIERFTLLTNIKPIVIYTMGKVGSTSIYYALKKELGGRVLFTHRMLQKNIEEYNKIFIKKGIKPHRSVMGKLIYKKKIKENKPITIITLIREPIARNISDFFQDFKVYNGVSPSEWNGTMEDLKNNFLNNFPHQLSLDWFDNECKTATNINVYGTPFNIEEGYQLFEYQNTELLLIKAELEDSKKSKIISEFIEIKNFILIRNNTATEKKYFQLYKSFTENLMLPEEYITDMLENKYAKHFYSGLEILAIKKRYT